LKITRKVFINKNNGQASLTLPRKLIENLKRNLKISGYPEKISLEVIYPKRKGIKKVG